MTTANEQDWTGERTITEFFPALSENSGLYKLANSIPLGLGLILYAPLYVIRAINPFAVLRYTLTNRRIRVDRGTRKNTIRSIALEDIDEIRIRDYLKFTRTGDLEVISKGEVVLLLSGVQDPEPIRKTILDAVRARVQVAEILNRQKEQQQTPVATA